MELHQLEYFVAVAEEASFTRAADRVHVAQPGVSAQVRRLESELGHRLLDRSARSVRLTEVGTAVLPFARAALDAVAGARLAVDELAGLVRGQVRVGMVSGCALPILAELLAAFHDTYPGVTITLAEDNSDRLIGQLGRRPARPGPDRHRRAACRKSPDRHHRGRGAGRRRPPRPSPDRRRRHSRRLEGNPAGQPAPRHRRPHRPRRGLCPGWLRPDDRVRGQCPAHGRQPGRHGPGRRRGPGLHRGHGNNPHPAHHRPRSPLPPGAGLEPRAQANPAARVLIDHARRYLSRPTGDRDQPARP